MKQLGANLVIAQVGIFGIFQALSWRIEASIGGDGFDIISLLKGSDAIWPKGSSSVGASLSSNLLRGA